MFLVFLSYINFWNPIHLHVYILFLMNTIIEEHAISYLDSSRTFHKDIDSLQNVYDNWFK